MSPGPGPRIALGSVLTECNQFGGLPIDLEWFSRYELRWGDEVLAADSGVVGGALDVLRQAGADVAPLLSASTCPGGYITADCYARLRGELLARLRDALPVDGVLLPLHGSAVAEGVDDVEGDLLAAARALVGDGVPIVGTLDLHAHVTRAMVESADGLVAWETYPHRDAAATGARGARLLLAAVAGRVRPAMALAKVPVIVGAFNGSTDGDGPFARLMRRAKALEGGDGVLSTSAFLVHTFLDQPDLGSGGLVITDGDPTAARVLATDLARQFWDLRHQLEVDAVTPEEAIRAGLRVAGGPVVLVETADCAGGGAAGDSAASLKALLALGEPPAAIVPIVDPAAAAACHTAGVGGQVTAALGHALDPRWGRPVTVTGRVERLHDGRFRYAGGIWAGVEGNMGPTAVLRVGQVRILLATHATYDWWDEQLRAVDLDATAAKFVVAKNPMNFHNIYDGVAAAVYVLDTPGPTPTTIRNHPLRRMGRPYFPADADIPGLEPTVWTNADLWRRRGGPTGATNLADRSRP